MRNGILITVLTLMAQALIAQPGDSPDFMRSTGKIYVVAGVCLIILLVILYYLVRLDRKVTLLEKRQKHE